MGRVDKVIRIPSSLEKNFFRYWLDFLRPVHNLTDREMDIAACFLKTRYELSKKILDEELLNTILMNEDTKKKIRQECNMSLQHFQLIMGKFRKSKIVVDGVLNPKLIPTINEENGCVQLLLYFDIKDLKKDE
jgi:hypothetical protein